MTPVDPYVLAGTPLDLSCRIDRTQYKGPRTANDIEFSVGQEVLPPENVYVENDDLAHLHVENVSTISFFNDRNNGRFYCRLPKTRNYNKTDLGVQLVHVASKWFSFCVSFNMGYNVCVGLCPAMRSGLLIASDTHSVWVTICDPNALAGW